MPRLFPVPLILLKCFAAYVTCVKSASLCDQDLSVKFNLGLVLRPFFFLIKHLCGYVGG